MTNYLERFKERARVHSKRPTSRTAAAVIVAIWLTMAGLLIWLVYRATS